MSTLLLLALLPSPHVTPPLPVETEDYFAIITADAIPYNPARAHTFAAMVQVERTPGGPARIVSTTSLSWLPVTMNVRAFALRSETGRNVPLIETLEWAKTNGFQINCWGPFRVTPEFANTFRARVHTVENCFQYKGACLTSPKDVCDCARSIEEMINPYRRYIGVFGYGAAAGSYIVKKFSPWLIEPTTSHRWVATVMGLDAYSVCYRAYGDFTNKCDQFKAWMRR